MGHQRATLTYDTALAVIARHREEAQRMRDRLIRDDDQHDRLHWDARERALAVLLRELVDNPAYHGDRLIHHVDHDTDAYEEAITQALASMQTFYADRTIDNHRTFVGHKRIADRIGLRIGRDAENDVNERFASAQNKGIDNAHARD